MCQFWPSLVTPYILGVKIYLDKKMCEFQIVTHIM